MVQHAQNSVLTRTPFKGCFTPNMKDTVTNHNENKCQELCCILVYILAWGISALNAMRRTLVPANGMELMGLGWLSCNHARLFACIHTLVCMYTTGNGCLSSLQKLQAAILFPTGNSAVSKCMRLRPQKQVFYKFNYNCG